MVNHINFSQGTEEVINAANQIESLADEFYREYTALYDLIRSDLANVWKGEDYTAFEAKTNDAHVRFDQMREILNEYATVLRNAAQAHEARMAESMSQASQVTFE